MKPSVTTSLRVFLVGLTIPAFAQGPLELWHAPLLVASNWPHSEKDVRTTVTPRGLRVEVAAGRTFAIAAASRLSWPFEVGRIRVRVAELGGGAKWFVRLYGELRQSGERRTVGIAQDEISTGERVFDLDPRLRTLRDAPVQLQLGVEGAPGAFTVFEEVALLAALQRSNRPPRPLPANLAEPGSSPTRMPGRRGSAARPDSGAPGAWEIRSETIIQKTIDAVELMPNLPEPFQLIDWRERARAYDRFVFDFNAKGEFLPLVWLDDSRINIDRPTFGLPSYVGAPDQAAGKRNSQEGITCMGAVLGATLVGIDKSRPARDYVAMCEAWFNSKNGINLVLNRQQDGAGGSFWYELFPHIVFYALADRYPDKPRLAEIMRVTADRWRQVCLDLADSNGVPDFNHLSFNFRTRQPVDNGKWREPDAAAAVAWLEYMAWMKFRDSNHLAAAESCLEFLQYQKANPYYEVLLPFGVVAAARLNAERGQNHDVDRLLKWCFGISDCRGGWGVTVGNWGGYDCDGLLGSIDNRGGYAFAMNTFVQAGALTPVARYDPRYARAIGKWMLNLACSARLFYPGALPAGHETSGFWKGDPQQVIAYEGLRYEWQGKSPCATGDPVAMNWGPKTDLGLYGSGYVGWLGAMVRPTSVPAILQLDCLATDFFHEKAWPTFLCYNPHPEARRFEFTIGPKRSDLYDVVQREFLRRDVRDQTLLTLSPDTAAVVVVAPAGSKLTRHGNRTLIDDLVVAWR